MCGAPTHISERLSRFPPLLIATEGRVRRTDMCLVRITTDEIAILDTKLDKLMTAYLENALTLSEYQNAKNKLVTDKHALNDKLASLAQISTIRFEPVINFFNDCKQAAILAKSDDLGKIRSFFQKVGSNPLVRDRALVFSPRSPFVFVTKIPKKSSNEGGGAEGGVWGGIPPRPPLVVCDDAISGDFEFSTNLCRFLNKVRTYFAENPD